MSECIAEDDLLDLASARRQLGDAPAIEAHLADCPACSGLLCTLIATAADDAPRRDRVGAMLGPYRLDAWIGAGAMGEVYRATDERLHRQVALKVLSHRLAGAPDRIRRLEAEARAAAAIAHPNVVTVFDVGTDDGTPYVVSELITGESLRSVIDRGPIARRTAVELGRQLARGLAAAHAQGVVHRDLKPGNLIVTDDGTLKILDFGLAKVTGDRALDATEPGTLVGTAGYLSPEQARGEPADARSDIFAAGAILYELVTGARAFAGATFAERLSAVLRDTPPPIDDPIGPIVARCLDQDPRKRFQSATDLAWVLDGLVADPKPTSAPAPTSAPQPAKPPARTVSRRTFAIGAALTGLGGLALGRLLAPSPRRPPPPAEFRQLSFRQGRVAAARYTPDGGSVVYAALWDDQPSTVFTTRLDGGGSRTLDLPPADLLAVSSRGQLALALDPQFAGGFYHRGRLALAPIEGGVPHELGVDVQDADFTPDGAELAIVRRAGGRFRLELPVGRVLLEAGWLARPRVSPDGHHVACLLHYSTDDDLGDLVIVSRAGGTPRTIAGGWSSIDGLAWASDGRALWISASRQGGNNEVRALDLDGRERAVVPSVGRLRVHDVARGGQLAVTHCTGRVRMMGKAAGAAEELDLALADVSVVGDVSGDGRSVVFAEYGDVDTASGAYLRPLAGGPAVRLGGGAPLDLADDGRGVLGFVDSDDNPLAVYPVPAGEPRLVPTALVSLRWARWCAGGGILVAGSDRGRPVRVWRLDPDGGGATPITDEGVVAPCAVSPDGARAAMIIDDRLAIVDVAGGGAPRFVPGAFAEERVCGWYTGGTDVIVHTGTAPIAVRRIDAASGAPTVLFTIEPPPLGLRSVFTVAVSLAGDAYAYSHSQELSRLYSMTTADLG